MDDVPTHSRHPTSDFLSQLQSKGYASWHVFDMSQSKIAFWKAIGLGIIGHIPRKYPSYELQLRGWKSECVKGIAEVDSRYSRDQGKDRFGNAKYWNELGSTCLHIAIDFYKNLEHKTNLSTILERGQLVEFGNQSAYCNLAKYLFLAICIYEHRSDSSIVTHFFASPDRNQFGQCINLAIEGNRLFFLHHQDINTRTSESFPFLLKGGATHPIVLGGNAAPEVRADPQEVMQRGLLEIIEAQASLLLKVCETLPSDCADLHSELRRKVATTKGIISSAGLRVNLEMNGLSKVLRLTTAQNKPPHTEQTCEHYPDNDMVTFHDHTFHVNCLRRYLLTLLNQERPHPICPKESCEVTLPDNALQLCPELVKVLGERKSPATFAPSTFTTTVSPPNQVYQTLPQTSAMAAFQQFQPQHPSMFPARQSYNPSVYSAPQFDAVSPQMQPVPPQQFQPQPPADIYPQVTCWNCSQAVPTTKIPTHGCVYCLDCIVRASVRGSLNCLCSQPFSQEELTTIQEYRQYYQLG